MALTFQIEGVKLLGEHVWYASLSPAEVRLLGLSTSNTSDRTVLLLQSQPRFDAEHRRLAFDPSTAKLLSAGTSSGAILIGSAGADTAPQLQRQEPPIPSGDAAFLASLPPSLLDLGRALLQAVRSKFPGELRLYPKSGRYVDTPDNFWTIKPQSRDISFRVTVRGTPDSFVGTGTLQIKPDQTGYSSFKVKRHEQVALFARVIDQVRRK